jgi:hypothetical protein
MTLLENLPHTVSHFRKKYSRDEYGGNITEQESRATGVKAWVQNAAYSEITEFQKQDEVITHRVMYASAPSLRPGDVVTVTAGPSFVGVEMEYKASTDRSAGLGVLFTAMCEEFNNKREAFDD